MSWPPRSGAGWSAGQQPGQPLRRSRRLFPVRPRRSPRLLRKNRHSRPGFPCQARCLRRLRSRFHGRAPQDRRDPFHSPLAGTGSHGFFPLPATPATAARTHPEPSRFPLSERQVEPAPHSEGHQVAVEMVRHQVSRRAPLQARTPWKYRWARRHSPAAMHSRGCRREGVGESERRVRRTDAFAFPEVLPARMGLDWRTAAGPGVPGFPSAASPGCWKAAALRWPDQQSGARPACRGAQGEAAPRRSAIGTSPHLDLFVSAAVPPRTPQ